MPICNLRSVPLVPGEHRAPVRDRQPRHPRRGRRQVGVRQPGDFVGDPLSGVTTVVYSIFTTGENNDQNPDNLPSVAFEIDPQGSRTPPDPTSRRSSTSRRRWVRTPEPSFRPRTTSDGSSRARPARHQDARRRHCARLPMPRRHSRMRSSSPCRSRRARMHSRSRVPWTGFRSTTSSTTSSRSASRIPPRLPDPRREALAASLNARRHLQRSRDAGRCPWAPCQRSLSVNELELFPVTMSGEPELTCTTLAMLPFWR